LTPIQISTVIEDAVRIGSLASLCCAVVAFVTNIALPRVIHKTSVSVTGETGAGYGGIAAAWSTSHFLFGSLMVSTFLVSSAIPAIILVAAVGVSWAFTLWVPFVIIGEELAKKRMQNADFMSGELEPLQQDQAGTIIGLHNCAISAPQILGALICSIIFWIAGKTGSEHAVGWVLRAGACASFVAGWLAKRSFKQQ
jgi:solute carrier family 45 protein 1/2/4